MNFEPTRLRGEWRVERHMLTSPANESTLTRTKEDEAAIADMYAQLKGRRARE
jgi:hypothetical protein